MMAARQIFLGRAAGVKLPYDAEVEYLESTGTQYIDTGLKLRTADTVAVTCYVNSDVTTNWYGVLGSYDGAKYFILKCFSRDSGRMNWLAEDSVTFDANRYEWITTSHTLTSNSGVAYESLVDAYLFAYNNRGSLSSKIAYRISAFSVTRDGVKILDFIPVRFTNELGQSEGAMYDRVSKRLFRNAGTGSFLYGGDVYTVPVETNQYVQDGLIAMWDGIEQSANTFNLTYNQGSLRLDGNFGLVNVRTTGAAYANIELNDLADVISAYKNGEITVEYVLRWNLALNNQNSSSFLGTPNLMLSMHSFAEGSNQDVPVLYIRDTIASAVRKFTPPSYTDSFYAAQVISQAAGKMYAYCNSATYYQNLGASTDFSTADVTGYRIALAVGNALGCIRFYNRALTAEEIAANYAVDKQRFNLP